MTDTKYADLNKNLSAVGKAVFVNFYYDFKDFSISNDELAKKFFLKIQILNRPVIIFVFQEQDTYLNVDKSEMHYVLLLMKVSEWIQKR